MHKNVTRKFTMESLPELSTFQLAMFFDIVEECNEFTISCKRLGEHSNLAVTGEVVLVLDMQKRSEKLLCNLYAKRQFLMVKDWPTIKGSQPMRNLLSRVSYLQLWKHVCLKTQTTLTSRSKTYHLFNLKTSDF